MDDRELRALEDPEEWDSDRAEVRPPSKSARAVVSVAFARDDFGRVSEAARREGMKTSEFIREAALARAAHRPRVVTIYGVSGRSGPRGIGEDITAARRGRVRVSSSSASPSGLAVNVRSFA